MKTVHELYSRTVVAVASWIVTGATIYLSGDIEKNLIYLSLPFLLSLFIFAK